MQSFTAQNYTFGAYDWEQVNTSGFGEVGNDTIQALSTFGGSIYAGTSNEAGAQLWRSTDGESWTSITTDGFGDVKNLAVDHLYEFDGSFYAGTQNADNPSQSNGGEVWRSDSGDAGTWNQVVSGGFGDSVNGGIYRFIAFNNQLYASTFSWDTSTHGGEIWRSSSGDSESWSRVVSDGFGDSNNASALSFAVFDGYIYVGTQNFVSGGEVWRSDTGNDTSWEQVNADGFGTLNNTSIPALAAFDGYLYAVTRNDNGAQVWRCQTCDQGNDWTNVSGDFDGCNQVSGLEVYKQKLYLVAGNNANGLEVWRSSNGTDWGQIADGGFDDPNNEFTFRDNSLAVFDYGLFVGTYNGVDGGEIWRYQQKSTLADFDGDGDTDVSVFRPSDSRWFIQGQGWVKWGIPNDIPVPGDYDGDGETDIAVYRPSDSRWFIQGQGWVKWGIPNDIPVPGDYDGDGETDIAVYRPSDSRWFIQGQGWVKWGVPNDIPVPGDYDGDGETDIAVYRPSDSRWFVQGQGWVKWGIPNDIPVPGDYDGDGETDIAVYRPSDSRWFIQGQGWVKWGISGDIPVPPRDTNGDGDPYH
jgi:hypothetical protein